MQTRFFSTAARVFSAILLFLCAGRLSAVTINVEWNNSSGTWNQVVNWSPNSVPDNGGGITYDVEIGNRVVAHGALVTFVPQDGTADTVTTLTLTNGADLLTNSNQLTVTGLTTLDGAGGLSTIVVQPHATPVLPAFQAATLDISNGASVIMAGGLLLAGTTANVNAGSTLQGYGTLAAGDLDLAAEQAFQNSGTIQISGTLTTPGLLTLQINGADTIDLDGDNEAGVVDVSNASGDPELDSLTLVVDGPLADAFNSTLQIGQRDTILFNRDFTLAGATVQMTGGAFSATLGGPGAAALITSSSFTISGNAVLNSDLTFSGSANTITLNPSATLTIGPDATVTLPHSAALVFGNGGQLIVNGDLLIDDYSTTFDWDGPSNNVVTTVGPGGFLNMKSQHINGGNNVFSSTINLQGGTLGVHPSAPADWTMAGTLNHTGGASDIHGLTNITGTVNVNQGFLTFHFDTTLANGSHLNIASGAHADTDATTFAAGSNADIDGTLRLVGGSTTFAGPATLGGSGLLWFASNSTVTANTTINTTSFDWDGSFVGLTHTINNGVTFTINSTLWDADDDTDFQEYGDVEGNIILNGNGAQLLVNGVPEWTLWGELTTNPSGLGTATIGGTSRMVLLSVSTDVFVKGTTVFSAPVTFGIGSATIIDPAKSLTLTNDARYGGSLIGGNGFFNPSNISNTVTSGSDITAHNFNFDRGDWVINPGANLRVSVQDYDSDSPSDVFDATLTLNGGRMNIEQVGIPEFVFDGVLNFVGDFFHQPTWEGHPLNVGDDAGALDADVNVTGPAPARITSQVTFKSDADVHIAAGATLQLLGGVRFQTVNGANAAEFTGAGTLLLWSSAIVQEPLTLNMTGGTVDLDPDVILPDLGNPLYIHAPMVVNATTLLPFGVADPAYSLNTMQINNLANAGTLTVNLDAPGAEWTIGPDGILELFNDATPVTLLAGAPVNINGHVHVQGDVRLDARVDIGNVQVAIQTAGEPLRLSGGTVNDPNTIAGATVIGPGLLGADGGIALRGFGNINADVDFDGTAALRADDGMLNINGNIIDVFTIGTADADGILNVTNPWNTVVASSVNLLGGELRGATITNDTFNGVSGRGLLSARIINNSRITQMGASSTLVVETGADDNDWDGALNSGTLEAVGPAGTLELRDNAAVQFGGTVTANNATVFINGFDFEFEPGSTLNLSGGILMASTTRLSGALNVAAGPDSTIDIAPNRVFDFEAASLTTLNGNLWLTHDSVIRNGANFAGLGVLGVSLSGHLTAENGANINALIVNDGRFLLADTGVGRVDAKDYQQANTGRIEFDFAGPGLAQFDRLVVSGAVQLAGRLETALTGGFVPTIGQSFTIISATGGVTGEFDSIPRPIGIPIDQKFEVTYSPTLVQLTVVADTYWPWVNSFADIVAMGNAALAKNTDPDHDGQINFAEFALDGDPSSGGSKGKMVAKIAPVGGVNAFTLTFPVRAGAIPALGDPAGGELVLEQTIDDMSYSIQASDDLATWTLDVSEVTGGDAVAIQAGLPPLSPGWGYRTFRSPGPVAGDPMEFMRVVIANTE